MAASESAPDGLWIIDERGKTVYANEAMARILGTSVDDLHGKDSFQYVFPEDLESAGQQFAAKREGNRSPFHFRLRRADGSAIWVDVQANPMHNAKGNFIGIVGSFTISKSNKSSR